MPLRMGAVSYLNTKPLIHGLQERFPEAELVLDLPSRLADQLRENKLDVALIPSVEFLRSQDWNIVSDACIACHGQVRSVRVLFRRPPAAVRSLALDEGSRTSVVLARVLLARRFGIRPEVHNLGINQDFMAETADAVVIIGDRAMQVDESQFDSVWDLGEVWNRETGLPFVFAMWVTNNSALAPDVATRLQECRDDGLTNLDQLVATYASHHDLTASDCKKYFSEQLYFHLGESELLALDRFRGEAIELGLIPSSSSQLSLQPL